MDLWTTIIGVAIGGLIIFSYYQLTYWSRRNVPHLPTIPIIGNTFAVLMFFGIDMANYVTKTYQKIPNVKYFGMMMGKTPTIMLKDPELIRDLCIKNFNFAPDHDSFVDERMDPILARNLFSLRGDRWKTVRNALSPSYTVSKMKFIFQLISKVSANFVEYFEENSDASKLLNVKDAFTRYTTDVIATAAFGMNVDSLKVSDNEFYLKGKDAINFRGLLKTLKFIFGSFCPRLMRFLGIPFLSKDTNRFFIDLIHETVKLREEKGIQRPDMIHLLMEARNDKFEVTIDDIVAQSILFFMAGFETSSSVMSFIAYLLAYHPNVQDQLRAEVDSYFKEAEVDDGELTYESLAEMKYLDMVINETLRLYPPNVIIVRVCAKSFDLPPATSDSHKLTVSPGSHLWIPVYAIQRDPKYFPNPDDFDPDRFADNSGNNNSYTFLPFGIGPRRCIGERFALMKIKLIFARIIHKFVIKTNDETMKNIVFDTESFSLTPKGGLWLTFHKRT